MDLRHRQFPRVIPGRQSLMLLSQRYRGWLLLCMGLFLASGLAQARSMRGDDLSDDMPIAPFRITERSGELGLQFNYLRENEQNDGVSDSSSNRTFEQYILNRLKGYVYHPRFLEFDVQFKLGMAEQNVKNSGSDAGDGFTGGSSNTFLYGYDIYLTFLKRHPFSASVYANHDRSPVMELFTDRQMIETTNQGATFNWKKGPFPMDLSISQSKMREWGFDSKSESTIKNLEYSIRNNLADRMFSEMRYRYQDYEQTFDTHGEFINNKTKTRFKSHDLSFTNTWYLDPSRQSYLLSNVRYFQQSGTQDLKNFYVQERLNLQHTPNFRTYYLTNYLQNELKASTIRTYYDEVGLEHSLFKSLDTHLDLHWRESDFGSSSEKQYGPTGRFNYRKDVPYGRLTAGYGRTVDQVERTGNAGVRTIIDESVTLKDTFIHYLNSPGAVPGSINVTNTAGLITYTEGFDYKVVVQGNRTGIQLLLGGLIKEGDTVLVDYDAEFTSDIKYFSDDQDFNIQYDIDRSRLKGLSLYYRWHDLAARNAPKEDISILQFTDWLAGFSYNWRRYTWTEEYQDYNSNFSKYDQILNQIEGNYDLGHRIRLGWDAGMLMIDYKDDDLEQGENYSNVLFAGATMHGPIRQKGYWDMEARARKETGQTDELLLGIMGKLGLRWRKSRVEAGARFEERNRFDSKQDRMQLFLQLAREF